MGRSGTLVHAVLTLKNAISTGFAPFPTPFNAVSTLLGRFALMQIIDASLPTGGFAHSGGLEAAAQLGLLGFGGGSSMQAGYRVREGDLLDLMESSMRSQIQLQGPFDAHSR